VGIRCDALSDRLQVQSYVTWNIPLLNCRCKPPLRMLWRSSHIDMGLTLGLSSVLIDRSAFVLLPQRSVG
jgi:hypothetical protein